MVDDLRKLGIKSWLRVAREWAIEESCAGSRGSHQAVVLMTMMSFTKICRYIPLFDQNCTTMTCTLHEDLQAFLR